MAETLVYMHRVWRWPHSLHVRGRKFSNCTNGEDTVILKQQFPNLIAPWTPSLKKNQRICKHPSKLYFFW